MTPDLILPGLELEKGSWGGGPGGGVGECPWMPSKPDHEPPSKAHTDRSFTYVPPVPPERSLTLHTFTLINTRSCIHALTRSHAHILIQHTHLFTHSYTFMPTLAHLYMCIYHNYTLPFTCLHTQAHSPSLKAGPEQLPLPQATVLPTPGKPALPAAPPGQPELQLLETLGQRQKDSVWRPLCALPSFRTHQPPLLGSSLH